MTLSPGRPVARSKTSELWSAAPEPVKIKPYSSVLIFAVAQKPVFGQWIPTILGLFIIAVQNNEEESRMDFDVSQRN
jgi:hypothetical protein